MQRGGIFTFALALAVREVRPNQRGKGSRMFSQFSHLTVDMASWIQISTWHFLSWPFIGFYSIHQHILHYHVLRAHTTDWDTTTPSKSLYWVMTNLSMVPHNINPTYGFFSIGSWMAEWAHKMRGSARWRDSCLFERWYQRGSGDFSPRRHCPDTLFASCHTAELESTQMVEGRCGTQRHFCMENKAWHTWAHTHWLGITSMIDHSAHYFHK